MKPPFPHGQPTVVGVDLGKSGSDQSVTWLAVADQNRKLHGVAVAAWNMPRPICEAPKDRPILAWCDHEADPYVIDERTGQLSLYAAHAEGLSHAPTGWHIVVWGGAYCDTGEYGVVEAELPDWWFTRDSDFECAANPVWFYEMPPSGAQRSGEGS